MERDFEFDAHVTEQHGKTISNRMKLLNRISYLRRVQIPSYLWYNENFNKYLVVRFNQNFNKEFDGLENVFLYLCKSIYKVLHLTKRKVFWVNKAVPEEVTVVENQPLTPVECYRGKGDAHLYV